MSTTKNDVMAFKRFHAAAAAYILGEKTHVTLRGSQDRIVATQNVLNASKTLYEELNKDDASINAVSSLINKKKKAAHSFHQITGIPWLL